FDGDAWRPVDLERVLAKNAWPTLVDVSVSGEEAIAVGTQVEGSCLIRVDANGTAREESVGAHSLYACSGLEGGEALILANDGAWRGSTQCSRVTDLSGAEIRPFGRPSSIALH